MTNGTTTAPAATAAAPSIQQQIGTVFKTVITDFTSDEKTALKPVLLSAFDLMASSNPDAIGWAAIGQSLLQGILTAQVAVKGQLVPQLAALGKSIVSAW